jgi:hypothetical protein
LYQKLIDKQIQYLSEKQQYPKEKPNQFLRKTKQHPNPNYQYLRKTNRPRTFFSIQSLERLKQIQYQSTSSFYPGRFFEKPLVLYPYPTKQAPFLIHHP